MKKLFLMPIIFFGLFAHATNYYLSNSGNDSNNGTDPSSSWQSLARLNSLKTLKPGDNVFFKRGDTFYGNITIANSGASGNPITFGAYGSGNKPVITGLTSVTNWTNLGGNIWESTSAISTLAYTNMVVINVVNTPMGRYPNTGFLTYQSHVGNTSITSSALTGSWVGAELVIKKTRYNFERGTIKSQSGNTLNYVDAAIVNPTNGFGLFIQNDSRTLDQQNEWYYNPLTKRLRVYSSSSPSNVQIATVDSLIYANNKSYIAIDNISFSGANSSALKFNNSTNITITNCDINFAGINGIYADGGAFDIENNIVKYCNDNGIIGVGPNSIIKDNTLKNIRLIEGMTQIWSFASISARAGNTLIQGNNIDSSGYNGIEFEGNNTTVSNNFINHSCLIQDDGGGIYTAFAGTNKQISNNIILNTIGMPQGTDTPTDMMGFGIYLDSYTSGVSVSGNSISGCFGPGIFASNVNNNSILNNTLYDNCKATTGFFKGEMMVQHICCNPVRNLTIKNNILFAKTAINLSLYFYSIANDIPLLGTSDNNFFARPMDDNLAVNTKSSVDSYLGIDRNLSGWRAYTGQDANSKKSPKTITNINDLRFEYNATASTKTVSLDANYIDVKGTVYNGTITLAPYTSAVLIKNGALTKNEPPVANAGPAQTITLPNNIANLSGSGTSSTGIISTYIWTKIAGPAGGVITNPNTASTSITGLVQGIYKLELKVTDNLGTTAKDTLQIVVNSAPTNSLPVANAGPAKNITLPVNTATLNGSGNVAGGTIVSHLWTKVSGPITHTIVNASSPVTDVLNLVSGVYQFEFKVTDNKGAIARDTTQIMVNAPSLVSLTANAGPDQTITLPTNRVNLSGSGTGPILAYQWRQLSGPSNVMMYAIDLAATSVTGLIQGVYQFELKVLDSRDPEISKRDTMKVTVNAAVNIPPVANAGGNKTITLPINKITLAGSGTDADGTVVSYLWTKISGPTSYSIVNAASPVTDITGLIQGIYQFELKVTDNNGAIARDTTQIMVNAASLVGLTANAGPDQTITLPTNRVNLSGSGTGPILAYQWRQLSGPSNVMMYAIDLAATSVTGLIQGVYQFELKVLDSRDPEISKRDTMKVTVNAAANIPPVANAGGNKTITLPVNKTTLTGSGTDADGTVVSYLWTKITGPTSYSIVNAASPVTDITGLIQGIYQFELKVTDNNGAVGKDTMSVTVNPAANIPPVANAGGNKTITLPINKITLAGSGTDTDGTVVSYLWTKISGPSSFNIANATSPVTDITGLIQGTYQFELKVTDNNGAVGRDTMQVTVNAANIPPVANAGGNKTITLPVNKITLTGSGTDADGTVVSYLWTKIAGPTSFTIVNAASPITDVSGLVQGIYKFELKITDNNGAVGRDTMQLIVNAAANIPPVANAGGNKTITLPINKITLAGSGTDADGTIINYLWTKISGPTSFTIVNAASPATDVSGLVQGIYQFELKITDNNGAVGKDTMQVIVNAAANIPPVANAGGNKTITLPVNKITLAGSGTDADGTITNYLWTKISGPSSYSIVNAASPITDVTGLIQGTYQFELKVTDNNGAIARDTTQIMVNAPSLVSLTANAGPDQTITLPTNRVNLSGSGTGPILAYQWRQLSGPSNVMMYAIDLAATSVTGLIQGVYQFELKVLDSRDPEISKRDTMKVIVNAAANIPPVANAGGNKTITLPINKITLAGSGTDADGTITNYLWTKISGPTSFSMVNAASPITDVSGLVQGIYKFELKVTDNYSAVGRDTIQVTVNAAANIPPIANAGDDITILYPMSSVTLKGSGTDIDGNIISYSWKQLAGPSRSNIVQNTKAATAVNNLIAGNYEFELTVTDNNGAIGKDTMKVLVTLGRLGFQSNSLKIYPNPVKDIANLEIGTMESTLLITISDLNGKIVYTKSLSSTNDFIKEQINMSRFASGIYTVTVLYGKSSKQVLKVVKL